MAGAAIGDLESSACQAEFVATGIAGLAEDDGARGQVRIWRVNVRCTQLKSTGLATLTSDGSAVGAGTTGEPGTSKCKAGDVMVGIAYGINQDANIGGFAAICAPLDQWADESASPEPATMPAVGDAATASGTLSCAQGSVLTGIKAHGFDVVAGLTGVCTEITRTLD